MRSVFKAFFVLLAVIANIQISYSQVGFVQFMNDGITGKPVKTTKYNDPDIKGSPYLNDDWAKGVVKLEDGVSYNDKMYLKYNQADDELYFKGDKDEMLSFVKPVKEFTINYIKDSVTYSKHYKNGYKNIPGYNLKTNFEVIAEGTVQVLKKVNFYIDENREFNSAVTTRSLAKTNKYFMIADDKVKQFKVDKKSLLSALGNKQPELENYIKNNNLSFKTDEDLAKLITYYNSI